MRRHIMSALAVLALLFVGVAPANAETDRTGGGGHHPTAPAPEWTQPVCNTETWTVEPGTVKIPSAKFITYKLDGQKVASGSYDLESGDHSVKAYFLGHKIGYWSETINADPECFKPAEPVEPTITQAICDQTTWTVTPGTITIPNVENVYYTINGEKFDAGIYQYDAGTYTIKAYDSRTDDKVGYWKRTIDPNPECEAPPVLVNPSRPAVSDQTCDTPGFINLWLNEGVDYYLIDGVEHQPGTFVVLEPGTYHIEAILLDGYVLAEGAESAWDRTINAAENCDPDVEIQRPAAPVIVQPICDDEGEVVPGSITLEAIEHVTYMVDGVSTPAGTHVMTAGTYLVTATADAGFVFSGGVTTIEFDDVIVNPTPECETPDPEPTPTPTPTEDPDPEPTPTPTEDPEPTEEPSPTPSESPEPEVNNCEAYEASSAWCDPSVNDYTCDDVPATHRPMDLIDADNDPFELDSDDDGIGCELVPDDNDGDTNEDELPDTGSDGSLTMVLTVIGALLIAGGVIAAVAVRRRTA